MEFFKLSSGLSGGRSVMMRELEVISTSGCPEIERERERCITVIYYILNDIII